MIQATQQLDCLHVGWVNMRAAEFLTEEIVDEYAETDRSIIDALQQKGYRLLGSGVDQTAFAEPGTGHVLKVFGTDETNQFSADHRMFFKWYKFCEKNQNNPFLPRFYGHESFMWPPGTEPKEQHRYLMIRTEELEDAGNAGSVLSAMASEIAHDVNIDDIIRFSKEINPNSFDKLMKKIGDRGLDQFLSTVKKLFLIGERAGYSWDLHDGNIMMRADGTPVINDPWVL